MDKTPANMAPVATPAGITKAGTGLDGVEWSILGHTYRLKTEGEACFSFETLDPPGTFVPPHVHPTQDEFIFVLEGRFDLYLDGAHHQAHAGDLVRMPMGIPHGYYNLTDQNARALFWVSPARRLRELFDNLHNLGDPAEVVRQSAMREVLFLKPEEMAFDPLNMT
ncbi:cupin domain-containing protein [Salinarimonas ramus]|uniref:Cupin n=1 Tax=Salinarimonas ramus TaxID=690164 RepID=A0A917V583_9HYPH|nr:cupin domain-containing protein [Salinarimonas ramus]GGK38411.1 cupin [Salinarimonas ramus]